MSDQFWTKPRNGDLMIDVSRGLVRLNVGSAIILFASINNVRIVHVNSEFEWFTEDRQIFSDEGSR